MIILNSVALRLQIIQKMVNILFQILEFMIGIYFCTGFQSDRVKFNSFWILKIYSKSNSSNEHVGPISNTLTKVVFHNYLLNVFSNGVNELIYLKPETYILLSNLHLGIVSFGPCHSGKWVLNFHD